MNTLPWRPATEMSDDPRQRYQQAIDALNRCEWSSAQALAMRLAQEIPPHAGVFFVAGVAAREMSQVPLAIECLEKALDRAGAVVDRNDDAEGGTIIHA